MAVNPELFREGQKRKQAIASMEEWPLVEIAGVVDPRHGPGGGGNGDDTFDFSFGLSDWRLNSGPVRHDLPLRVHRLVTNKEIRQWMKTIEIYAVIRVEARFAEHADGGPLRALLTEYRGEAVADAELQAISARLQEPVTFEDALLGTFKLNRQFDWYDGEIAWAGVTANLNVIATQEPELQRAMDVAHTLLAEQKGWDARLRECAAEELLEIKNKAWLEEGEAEATTDEFRTLLKLESLSVEPDGGFEFWFDDGDLFWGHAIMVAGNLDEGPTRVDLCG